MGKEVDVIVVGGGPCGSYSALTAAKLGAEVIVCEEHAEIGAPAHCAGHLSLSGLKLLGIRIPSRIIENEFKVAAFYSPSGREFKVVFRSPVTCSVNRGLFDKHLAELAIRAGVQYHLESKVESLAYQDKHIKGVVSAHYGSRETLISKIVIDAEGISSVLLKKAGLQTFDRLMAVNAIQAEVKRSDGLDEDTVEVYLGRRFAPGFYAWIMPRRDKSAKIGLATRIGDPRKCLRWFMQNHPVASKKLRRSKVTSLSLHPISLGGPIQKTYSNGLLIVGDAASQVKPTTGGGIIFGLLCSRIAGEVTHRALENNNYCESLLSRYQSRWRDLIGFDIETMLRIRRLLNRMPDSKVDKVIDLCARFEVGRILEETGDLDFEGRAAIHMLLSPSALIIALYSILSSLPYRPFFYSI